jgi:hypothetical protein
MRLLLVGLLTVALAMVPPVVANAAGEMCTDGQELDKYRLLRRISLDLRSRVPDISEYEQLHGSDGIPETMLDEWLVSDPFRVTMRRFHASLLWPNPGGVQFNNVQAIIAPINIGGETIWDILSTSRRNKWRSNNQGAYCADVDQLTLGTTAEGFPSTQTVDVGNGQEGEIEGWVWVSPYWDPNTSIKVCAFAAMEFEQGKNAPCGGIGAFNDPGCGCGPELRWCYGDGVTQAIRASMSEQIFQHVDALSVGDGAGTVAPYSDLILSTKIYSNGTLDFFDKHLAPLFNPTRTMDLTGPGDRPLPDDPDFTDNTWVESDRGWPHAGIQTMAAYTLRFNTNRARANRFRIAFTHQYFVPPAVSDTTACTTDAEDLTQRCVCKDCHQVVEPLAAYWAFHAQNGSGMFTDEDIFPPYNATCADGAEGLSGLARFFCELFYVVPTSDETVRPGWLLPLQYADPDSEEMIHQQIYENSEGGPGAWAEELVTTGVWQAAMVQHLWQYLMGRPMNLDLADPDNELGVLATLATNLQADDSLPALVSAMIALPAYRRVR